MGPLVNVDVPQFRADGFVNAPYSRHSNSDMHFYSCSGYDVPFRDYYGLHFHDYVSHPRTIETRVDHQPESFGMSDLRPMHETSGSMGNVEQSLSDSVFLPETGLMREPIEIRQQDVTVNQTCTDCSSDLLASCPTVNITALGNSLKCIVDSGAEASMIPYSVYTSFSKPPELWQMRQRIELKGANDQLIPIMGFVCVPVTIHDHYIENACFIVKSRTKQKAEDIILGNNILQKLPDSCPLNVFIQVNNSCPVNGLMNRAIVEPPLPSIWEAVVTKTTTLKSWKVYKVPYASIAGPDLSLASSCISWDGRPL